MCCCCCLRLQVMADTFALQSTSLANICQQCRIGKIELTCGRRDCACRQLPCAANADMHRIMVSYCAGIYAPICLKKAVDALGGVVNQAAVHRTVQALLLSGVCRVFNTLAKEAQGPMFTPVAQVCLHLSHWPSTARRLEGKGTGSGAEPCSHYHGCHWTAVTCSAL